MEIELGRENLFDLLEDLLDDPTTVNDLLDDSMIMIAVITFNSSLVPLFEGLRSPNSCEFEISDFRRNRTENRARSKRRGFSPGDATRNSH